MKKNLAKKVTLSILAGAVLMSSSVAYAVKAPDYWIDIEGGEFLRNADTNLDGNKISSVNGTEEDYFYGSMPDEDSEDGRQPHRRGAGPPSGTLAVPAGRRLPPVPGRACRTARVSRAAAGRRGWEHPRRDSRIDRKQGIRFSSFPLFLAAGAAAVGGCRIQGTGAVDPVPYLSPAGGQVMEGHPPLRVAFCVMPQGRPRPHPVRERCRPASGAA